MCFLELKFFVQIFFSSFFIKNRIREYMLSFIERMLSINIFGKKSPNFCVRLCCFIWIKLFSSAHFEEFRALGKYILNLQFVWFSLKYLVWFSLKYLVWSSLKYLVWLSLKYLVWFSWKYLVWFSLKYLVWLCLK